MKEKLKRIFFSPIILNASKTKKIAYLGVFTALNVLANTFFEFRTFDIQFSLTIFFSMSSGVLLGGAFGFFCCVVGDLVGYMINSWGLLYMPWVGLATGLMALITGVMTCGFSSNKKGRIYLTLIISTVITFFVCTVFINSTGFYFYNKKMGFSTAVIDYVTKKFGGEVSYFSYIAYRLIFKGQIFNSIFNYALVFVLLPLILKIPLFNKKNKNDDCTSEQVKTDEK